MTIDKTDGLPVGELGPPLVALMALDASRPLPEFDEPCAAFMPPRKARHDFFCRQCGCRFTTSDKRQLFCSKSCAATSNVRNLEGRG
jgi:hypothetical protein